MKQTLQLLGEMLGFCLIIYVALFVYCVLCMSDGCPPGSLFYFLKMDKVLEYILRGYVYLRGTFAA